MMNRQIKVLRLFGALVILYGLLLIRCSSDTSTLVTGDQIYRRHCITCHGIDGDLMLNGAKDLSESTLPLEARKTVIQKGRGNMLAFEKLLSADQIDSVALYTLRLYSLKDNLNK